MQQKIVLKMLFQSKTCISWKTSKEVGNIKCRLYRKHDSMRDRRGLHGFHGVLAVETGRHMGSLHLNQARRAPALPRRRG